MSKIVKTILIIIILYAFQFFIIPSLYATYYPVSNEAFFIFVLTSIILCGIGFCVVNDKLAYWLFSDVVYALLILINCGNGLYGIGLSGLSLDGRQSFYTPKATIVGSIIATIVILVIQLMIKGIISAYKAKRQR